MNIEQKGSIAKGIISNLNEALRKQNKKLCEQNLFQEQKPLHGFEMLIKLVNLPDAELNKIAKAAGV